MKKLTSLEDTATITITGREAVMIHTLIGQTVGLDGVNYELFEKTLKLLGDTLIKQVLDSNIYYSAVQYSQEALAFPQPSKKDLMLKELQSKMDALQCEIDKIKGESF